jgi:hypothetical protein
VAFDEVRSVVRPFIDRDGQEVIGHG